MTKIQYAWMIYAAGGLGCSLAAWWMFLWAWRFVRYSAVVTTLVLLATPYSIDGQSMTLAPAIFTLVFEGLTQGIDAIKPLMKLMLGIWLIAEVLVVLFLLLTRKSSRTQQDSSPARNRRTTGANMPRAKAPKIAADPLFDRHYSRDLNRDERQARNELLRGEVPMRAIRD